jgi:ADP-ribose pyrophosphatase YjhB (NUDIX family)
MSPQRIEYHDSPDAPGANSLVPAVNVVAANDAGEILLIRRTDNGNWAVPGGAVDLGESVAQAAVRETLEETGIECATTGIIGIHSDPRHVIFYTSNGEARQEFSIVLTARPPGGRPTPSSESSQVRWVPESELPGCTMDRSMRIRVNDFLSRGDSPVITYVLDDAATAGLHSPPAKSSATHAPAAIGRAETPKLVT